MASCGDEWLLSVDPGVRGCGVALFRGSELEQAVYVAGDGQAQRAGAWIAMVDAVTAFVGSRPISQFVVELPQVYVAGRAKGDNNDLVQLAAVVGGLTYAFHSAAHHRVYLPAEWKGQAPKEIIHNRMLARLSPLEQGRISCRRQSLLHNVHDAVALGLKFLGRLDRPPEVRLAG